MDGGSSKTVALVASSRGHVVGAGRAGPSDIYDGGPAAVAAVRAAVRQALAAAGLPQARLSRTVFSLSGADWPADFAYLKRRLSVKEFGPRTVVNDAVGALYAGLPTGPGVSVTCGTGTATSSRGVQGELWHSSFWQEPGGGYDLALKTLRAVCRAHLGVDPPTSLSEAALNALEEPTVESALYFFTGRERPDPLKLTRLTRVLLNEAARGDATAKTIVAAHGNALGDYALVAARQVGIETLPFSLVLSGGVFKHPSPLLADALVARVKRDAPGLSVSWGRLEPVFGAVVLGFQEAGTVLTEDTLTALQQTSPPHEFFVT